MKRAVIFYSLSGNTKEAAELIANEISVDLIQIETKKPMPESFKKQIMLGGMQSCFGMKPRLKELTANLEEYDEFILGTPIWASRAAAPINSLLSKHGVADKVVAVFTFSGGGDNEKCVAALSKILKNVKTYVALADRNNSIASENKEKIDNLITELKK